MALFDLFKKKNDVQKEVDQMEKEREQSNRNVCATCGQTYPLETENCTRCNTRLYVENENFCMNPSCERCAEQHRFAHDDFVCDKCNTPTVVGNICGFNDFVD